MYPGGKIDMVNSKKILRTYECSYFLNGVNKCNIISDHSSYYNSLQKLCKSFERISLSYFVHLLVVFRVTAFSRGVLSSYCF